MSEAVRFRFRSRWQIAMRQSELPPLARLVGVMLSTWAQTDGSHCRPSVDTLADATGLKRSTVFKHLGELEAAGWIVRRGSGGRGRATDYGLTIPAPIEALLGTLLGPENRPPSWTVSEDLDEKPSTRTTETVHETGLNRPPRWTTVSMSLKREPVDDSVVDLENRPPRWTVSPDGPPGKSQESTPAPWQLAGYTWAEFSKLPLTERQAILGYPQDRTAEGMA